MMPKLILLVLSTQYQVLGHDAKQIREIILIGGITFNCTLGSRLGLCQSADYYMLDTQKKPPQ